MEVLILPNITVVILEPVSLSLLALGVLALLGRRK